MTSAEGSRGIQSIEVGGLLLQALLRSGRPLPLKELAAAAGMPAAKAHAYLVSLGRVGLVRNDAGVYGFGPLALQLGLISLQQQDPVRVASERLEPLALQTGCTVALALWGNQGPTVVRVAQAPSPLHMSLRHGTVLNLAQTATGQVMAAFRDAAEVDALWRSQGGRRAEHAAWRAQLAAVATAGHALSDEALLPGVGALAVPGCDRAGQAVWALVAVAPRSEMQRPAQRRALLDALRAASREARQQLGWA